MTKDTRMLHPLCTHIYPPYGTCTHHAHRVHHCTHTGSQDARTTSAAAAEPAVGLTLPNYRCGNGLIQGRLQVQLYSDYRLALGLVNCSARSSSLAKNVRKIGHGNFNTPCFTDCKFKDVWDQCMSSFYSFWLK